MKLFILFIYSIPFLNVAVFNDRAANVDYEKSKIGFSIEHVGPTAHGVFERFKIEKVDFEPNDLTYVHFEVLIEAASINTGVKMRDKALRGASYFDVEKYPNIHFVSKSAIQLEDSFYLAKGKLTIKDISKEIDLKFTYTNSHFKAELPLNRLTFGVGEKSWMLEDDLTAKIDIYLK